ncbi:MAG: virulence factor Mce family protein [Nocardioidaceae bacterium]|nr:virulence factor Mce family protein [Nocardioidaceae bacterium]
MITTRTKRQLVLFVIITLLGVAFVGARYARLDRLVVSREYDVTAQFTDSGGLFTGAEVTYRGVKVGQVSAMNLTRDGIDVVMAIDNSSKDIPADTKALVGNKSAVGEQYIELQPQTAKKPFLKDGSTITRKNTAIPVSTTALLTNLDSLVNSVPQGDLRTVVSELGAAFKGTGTTLGQIVDTSNAFIGEADRNFDVTTALIEDSNVVLRTQADKESAIRSFSNNLALFSGTLAGSDKDLRSLIDNGSATANELRTFLEANQVNLGQLISKLLTTGQVVVKHLKGVGQLLSIYPYVVEGAYSVLNKGPDGAYDANFGLVLTSDGPLCHGGYEGTDRRPPADLADRPMKTATRCSEPASKSNPRGAQNSPANRAPTSYAPQTIATYDHNTGAVSWTDQAQSQPTITYTGGAQQTFGKDSWKWLLLQPVAP